MRLEITDIRTLTDEQPSVRELEFRKPPVTLGSHSENLVQLPDIQIAPHYATFDIVGDQWVFKPTVPDGLVKRGGEPIRAPVTLHDGDVLEITWFSIRFTLDLEIVVDIPESGRSDDLARIREFPLPPRSEVRKVDESVSLNAARQASLADFTVLLRGCADWASVLEVTMRLMLTEFSARAAWMGIRRGPEGPLEFMDGATESGKPFHQPSRFETFEYRCLSRRQFIGIPRTGDAETQSVMAVPIISRRGAIGLLYVDSKKHTRVYDGADLDFLTAISRVVAATLDVVFDHREEAKKEQSAGGLNVVKEMQIRLDPRGVPDWPGLQFTAFTKGGLDSAGDIHDIMRLPNGLGALIVGHVTADPIRAAVAMAQIRGSFRIAGLHADPPRTLLKALNWLLFDDSDPLRFDAASLVVNPKTGVAELATAGAVGVLQIGIKGDRRLLADGKSPPVGSSRSFEYSGTTVRLQPGETLAFFTPGCVRVRNEADDVLSEERLVEALCDGFNRPASAAMEELLADLEPFFKRGRLPDDITVLLLHRPS